MDLIEEHDSIDIRSKEFQEVIGEPPSWLLRWGITAIFVAFAGLILVGYFLKYPETVTASVSLETSNPPVEITAPTVGTLTPNVFEQSVVEENTVIAEIANINSGNALEIAALDTMLTMFDKGYLRGPDFNTMSKWNLGPIESEYLRFYQAFKRTGSSNNLQNQTLNSYNESINGYKQDIIELRKEIADKQANSDGIPKQIEKLKDAYTDSKELADQLTLEEKVAEGERLKTDIKILKQQISDLERKITNQQNQMSIFSEEVQDNKLTRRENIAFAASSLRTKIDEWKLNYIIKAPISGTLVYQDKLKANTQQFLVDKGQKIFAIIPENAQDSLEGKMYLSSEQSIKITKNQEVKIKINAFKPSEYGLLNGVVIDKATLPVNGQYLVRVHLKDGMSTSKNKTIPFEHQMQGEAQIITNDRRFTGLIFDEFMKMLKR